MFDPTIYDNLKVVAEGELYDLDRAGEILVTGRVDLVNLASMDRTFRMEIARPDGVCKAVFELSAGVLDFAGELRGLRTADLVPGCRLRLLFTLPLRAAAVWREVDERVRGIWGEVAAVRHERREELGGAAGGGSYLVDVPFLSKIDEDDMDDIEPLLQHVVATLAALDEACRELTGQDT